jgi:hypothetical protein
VTSQGVVVSNGLIRLQRDRQIDRENRGREGRTEGKKRKERRENETHNRTHHTKQQTAQTAEQRTDLIAFLLGDSQRIVPQVSVFVHVHA